MPPKHYRKNSKGLIDLLNEWANGYRPLKRDIENRLVAMAQKGSKEARALLHKGNIYHNIKVAYKSNSDPWFANDATQESLIGFDYSIELFDVSSKLSIRTYSTWWSRQHISRFLKENRGILNAPMNVIDLSIRMRKLINKELSLHRPEPSFKKIYTLINIGRKKPYTLETALGAFMFLQKVESLDSLKTINKDGDSVSLIDMLEDCNVERPDAALKRAEFFLFIKRNILSRLDAREQDLISKHLGFNIRDDGSLLEFGPMTLKEIGDTMSLTKERVRQIKDKALKKLSEHLRRRGISASSQII